MTARTLVLDQGYQPHRIVSWQRAVSLLFQQKVELVESYDEPLMTPDQAKKAREMGWTFAIHRSGRRSGCSTGFAATKAVRFSRINVLTRDDWDLASTVVDGYHPRKLNYDHVVPRSRGGKTVWENIVSCCFPCNAKKDSRTPEEAKMPLRKQPYKPRIPCPVVAFHLDATESLPRPVEVMGILAWRAGTGLMSVKQERRTSC